MSRKHTAKEFDLCWKASRSNTDKALKSDTKTNETALESNTHLSRCKYRLYRSHYNVEKMFKPYRGNK